MDLILRNARLTSRPGQTLFDIGIEGGRIAAIEPTLHAEGKETNVQGRLVSAGFVETHIHLVRRIARRMADAGVALTVLPSTDLYLMGRHQDRNVLRGVVAAHELLYDGVNCSLSTNNVLNPFTPFGDCSLLRMANLYANICQVGKRDDIRACFEMITARSAHLMRRDDYGVEVGKTADLVVLDCQDRESAVAEVVTPLYGFKRGRPTFTRQPAELHQL